MKKLDIIILCGGLGKRIRSKSKNLPKILIDVKKKIPFIEFLFHSLNINNFRNIILSIGHRRSKLIKYSKKNPDLKLILNIEKKLLGTGGAVKNVLKNKNLTNPFLVVNGDSYYPFNLKRLLNSRVLNSKKSYILLKNAEKQKRFDQFKIIKKKLNMLKKNEVGSNLINSGLYLFYKKNFKIQKNVFSIEKDIVPKLIIEKSLNYIKNNSNIFFDIGVPKDLDRFKKYISKKKIDLQK